LPDPKLPDPNFFVFFSGKWQRYTRAASYRASIKNIKVDGLANVCRQGSQLKPIAPQMVISAPRENERGARPGSTRFIDRCL
jgi:hypothetical protein